MGIIGVLLLFIPVPFLFHFYEYGQHIKRADALFLGIVFLLCIVVGGFIARKMDIIYMAFIHVVMSFLSIQLALKFIPNDGGLGGAVLFIAVIYFLGQVVVRFLCRSMLRIE